MTSCATLPNGSNRAISCFAEHVVQRFALHNMLSKTTYSPDYALVALLQPSFSKVQRERYFLHTGFIFDKYAIEAKSIRDVVLTYLRCRATAPAGIRPAHLARKAYRCLS